MYTTGVLIILKLFLLVQPYKILVVSPFPGQSHSFPLLKITEGLAEKGHQVTSLGYLPQSKFVNHVHINLVAPETSFTNHFNLTSFTGCRYQKWFVTRIVKSYSTLVCGKLFASDSVRQFINQNHTFDLIIAPVFSSDCFLSFMHRFEAPVVGVVTSSLPEWVSEKFGNPTHPAYIPNNILDHVNPMSFWARLENLLIGVSQSLHYKYFIGLIGEKTAKQYFGEQLPSLSSIANNVSLLLVNCHFSFLSPRPLVPAVVEIGGIHIGKLREVSKNLEKWINESTHGVIYFSLGSMIKGHTFPDEKRQEFLKAFGRLPQRVLWKWENETMPGKPDNVMIQKWMPQLDILCHPNVKAFISHGGLLGTTEAVHCGVPAMVMPQYGDQFTNAKALEANGGGVILHLYEATEEKVYNALKTILDPKFKKQAEELSARFRDRPLPPLETAIYWVEYVARHRGAHHMRTAAVGMPLYKYLLLDVIAFLLLVFALISAFFFYVTRAVFRKLFGRKDKQKSD